MKIKILGFYAAVLFIFLCTLSSSFASPHKKVFIALIGLDEMATQYHRIYQNEEKKALQISLSAKSRYDKVVVLYGKDATLPRYADALLAAEKDPSVAVIDGVVYAHGQIEQVCFNGTGLKLPDCTPLEKVQEYFEKEVFRVLGVSQFSKTRALYSDSCYGATHQNLFRKLGFKVFSGSLGTDQNRAADYKIFMKNWLSGKSYQSSIQQANRYWLTPLLDLVMKGDSKKWIYGDRKIRIGTPL